MDESIDINSDSFLEMLKENNIYVVEPVSSKKFIKTILLRLISIIYQF